MITSVISVLLLILCFISCILLSVGVTGKKYATQEDNICYYKNLISVGAALFCVSVFCGIGFASYQYFLYSQQQENILNYGNLY